MKFVKTLLALAVVGAAVSAQAESNFVSGAAAVSPGAVARLDFRINVPKVLFLRVGTGTEFVNDATVDEVVFNVGPAAVITPGADVAGASSGGTINARIFGNGGPVSLVNAGSGAGLINVAGDIIPWTQILPTTTSGTFTNPAINATTPLAAVARIVNQTAVWAFAYDNTASVPEGSYTGRVTYTATML